VLKSSVLYNRMRDVPIQRDYHNVLLMSIPSSSSCLHVIDGSLPVYSESESLLVEQVGAYSHIDRIITTGTAPLPPAQIFGTEPAHDWCYYYQKASLARQAGDWKEVGRLYDQTVALHLRAADDSEVIPFFEGLVNLGRYDEAMLLFNAQIKGRVKMRLPLCNELSKDPGYPPGFGYDYLKIDQLLCNS